MRKVPALLAIGFILITFFRVSQFLQFGMKLGWLGVSFAIALTCGVYASAYFTQFKETKLSAFVALVPFALADLWFNEMEMVRSLAPETLIGSGANFLGFTTQNITTALHASALVYGALPTLFAALLGWLQADAEKVAILNKRGILAQIWMATKVTFLKGVRATLEDVFGKENFAQLPSGNSGKSLPLADDGDVVAQVSERKVRWEDLLAQDKDTIARMSPRQVMSRYAGISLRTANNWKQWVKEGK